MGVWLGHRARLGWAVPRGSFPGDGEARGALAFSPGRLLHSEVFGHFYLRIKTPSVASEVLARGGVTRSRGDGQARRRSLREPCPFPAWFPVSRLVWGRSSREVWRRCGVCGGGGGGVVVVVWWCGGVVVWWCGGVVVWWCSGVVVRWCGDVVVRWCGGVVVRWKVEVLL